MWRCFLKACSISPFILPVAGVNTKQVHMCINAYGRPSGEAYVCLPDEMTVLQCLECHRNVMGHRYIETFRSSFTEFQAAKYQATVMADSVRMATAGEFVMRMRGLPYSATDEDVRTFFGPDAGIPPEGVHIVRGLNGRATGEAFTEFDSGEALMAASTKDREMMGARYIELFQSSRHELAATVNDALRVPHKVMHTAGAYSGAYSGVYSGAYEMYGGGEDPCVVLRMRGLPFNATEADVVKFFEGLNIVPNGIRFTFTPDGRPSGECYVEFASPQECAAAIQKQHHVMGSRYVELFRLSWGGQPAWGGGWGGVEDVGYWPQMGYTQAAQPPPAQLVSPVVLKLRGIPYRTTPDDILLFFHGYQLIPDSIKMGKDMDGRASGEAWVTFASSDECARALLERQRQYIGNRYVELSIWE